MLFTAEWHGGLVHLLALRTQPYLAPWHCLVSSCRHVSLGGLVHLLALRTQPYLAPWHCLVSSCRHVSLCGHTNNGSSSYRKFVSHSFIDYIYSKHLFSSSCMLIVPLATALWFHSSSLSPWWAEGGWVWTLKSSLCVFHTYNLE